MQSLLDAAVFLILSLASMGISLSSLVGVGLIRLGLIVSYGVFVGMIHIIVQQVGRVASRPIRNH